MGSIFIEGDTKNVWEALTKEEQLMKCLVPGATLHMPELDEGEQIEHIYQPDSEHPETKTEMITIESVIPFQEFSFIREGETTKTIFMLKEDAAGTTVTVNISRYDDALERLKTLIEG